MNDVDTLFGLVGILARARQNRREFGRSGASMGVARHLFTHALHRAFLAATLQNPKISLCIFRYSHFAKSEDSTSHFPDFASGGTRQCTSQAS